MPPLSSADARTIVKRDAAATVAPTLTDAEVDALLTENVRASVWTASAVYLVGAKVTPTVRTGFYYVALDGGTASATEPATWPTVIGTTVMDGTGATSITWYCAGPDWAELYDLQRATYKAWLLKAAKASVYTESSADGQTLKASQVHEHCMNMASRWRPVRIG